MRSLLIDTTSSFITVAITEGNNVLYKYEGEILNDMSSKIIPIIVDAFNKVEFELSNIDRIFVVNGPGSFTGIRVGVTIAKTIAWALNIKIVPLSSLEFLATSDVITKYIVPMINARRGNVFAGVYDSDLNIIMEDKLINLDKLLCDLDETYTIVSRDNIKNSIKPNTHIIKIINKHMNDYSKSPHNLNPNYLKLTEAEEKRLND